MIKLEGFSDHFKLNDVAYQRGKYRIRVINDQIGIQEIGNRLDVAALTPFGDWTNGALVPYGSLAALRTDLRNFLFLT